MRRELADEQLILANTANGDQRSFGILYGFYKDKVYGYAFSIFQSAPLAEEIVQEVFLKLWLKRKALSDVNNFGAYLRITARNETLNALKKAASEQKNKDISSFNHSEIDLSTEQSISFNETNALLNRAINRLPKQQRTIYNLVKVDGMDHKSVASQLNISPLTVKVHLREALKSIRIYLSRHNELKTIPFLLFFLK